jgi:hypothetical protein
MGQKQVSVQYKFIKDEAKQTCLHQFLLKALFFKNPWGGDAAFHLREGGRKGWREGGEG